MAVKVQIDDIAKTVEMELSQYKQEVIDDLKKEIRTVAKEAVNQLKQTSPRDTGEYARGWKSKIVYESDNDIRVRIMNGTNPYLTHLLEFGHAKKGGGRVEGRPHIRPVEQEAVQKLMQKVKVIVR